MSRPATPPLIRFWLLVDTNGDCWQWIGQTNKGYGYFWNGLTMVRAHRFSYEAFNGPIPAGLVIDHLCRNPSCVNPDHLEAVTQAENIRRGSKAQQTHCKRGHVFTEANTYLEPPRCLRRCRACDRDRARARRAAA